MAGTLTPTPYQTVLDGDGVAVSGAKVYTYEAGTTTNATTYTTSALSVANANPIVADSAGRYVAYLSAGANLRFIIKTSADVTIDDQDNIQSVPGSSVNLDIEGTVGEAVTAGQVLYLSSAAEASPLTAGLWYLTDADAAPTSTSPQTIGVAVSAIAINTAGTIRLAGLVTTAGAVVVGTTYYVSATAGAITSSAPALSRHVGVAMTTSSLLLAATTAVSSGIPNPITQDLLFTDATYDIGKSGATRPRDGFFSRNAVVGGTLGVSGISTFTADLVATGASMSFQDNEGVVLGTGSDATIQYNGTDLVVAPAAVGSGDIVVTAASIEFADSEGVTLGTGKDATIQYDGTDLVIAPAAVGSGDIVVTAASIEFADDEGVTLGTGKDATLQYDGTNVSLDTQAVGSGLLIVTGSSAISGVEIDNTATDGDPTLAFTLSGTSLFTMGVDDGDSDKLKIGTTAIGTNTALTIDGSQNIGVGVTSPDGRLHVQTATAGSVTAGSGADDLVVENSTHVGMTFLSPSGNYQQTIAFGDVGDADSGRIVYDHNSDMLALWTSGVSWLTISAAGSVALPDAGLLDLSAILHDDTASQGLLLPQAASATPSSPSSGEGYLAWDASGNQIIAYTGSAWSPVGGSFDSTAVDSTTWSDGANASNTWTFDVSGTDTTMVFGSDAITLGADTVTLGDNGGTPVDLVFDHSGASNDFIRAINGQLDFQIGGGSSMTVNGSYVNLADGDLRLGTVQTLVRGGTGEVTLKSNADGVILAPAGTTMLDVNADGNHVFTSTLDAASGNETSLQIAYTTNKATSGDDTGLLISHTDTASPGTSKMLDLQVAALSVMSINNAGVASVEGITYTGIKVTSGSQSVANTATVAVTEADTDCTLLVFDNSTSGRMGLFMCLESNQVTSIAWSNALSPVRMSNTQGTATSLNVYYTGGVLTIENNLGSTLVVKWKLEKIN